MSVLDGPGEGTWSVFAMKIIEERDRLRERVAELESQLEDADLVMKDALGHANAAKEGWQTEYLRLDRDLDKIALALGVAGVGSHGAVNTRPSIERMVEEIEALVKARPKPEPPKMDLGERLRELDRQARYKARYRELWAEHILSECGRDEAHRRTVEDLKKEGIAL